MWTGLVELVFREGIWSLNRERSMESNAGVRQDAVIAVTMSVIGYAEARVECIRRPQSWQHRKPNGHHPSREEGAVLLPNSGTGIP